MLAGFCVCISLSAQPQQAPQSTLPARFSVQLSSDSDGVRNRHYTVTQYADAQCAKPSDKSRLYRKKYAKQTHTFKEIEIASSRPFYFQVDYLEKRRKGERSCSALLGFQPASNRSYRAVYQSLGQVSGCDVKLFDVTTSELQPVSAVDLPPQSCDGNQPSGINNGVPVHTVLPLF